MRISKTRIIASAAVLVLLAAGLIAYYRTENYEKYTDSFFDTFDTVVVVVAYTRSQEEFNHYFNKIHQRFQQLHKLYDIYREYPGMNNLKTVNDNAGIRPVKVDREIIDLILFAKELHRQTAGKTNIAMGAVLRIWHEYREAGRNDPETAALPPMAELREAMQHTDINQVIVDEENSTVYLADRYMSLDVGAVAKGYAAELVMREMAAQGLKSAMISAGGNIRTLGKPLDGIRERWGVGIQDPRQSIFSEDSLLDVVFINDGAVVSSGDYQRYYTVDGKRYHHLIDPDTLLPAEHYRSVTVVTEDSGIADFLSTELFLLPWPESRKLAERLGVKALWVMHDGTVETTEEMRRIMRSHGASGAVPQ
ncbi:MAG TPA: FAD:protein FMN transferase [Firmicutes bacterium]|nr:FAD:protein FMN transferase [Bacillota bacterium]